MLASKPELPADLELYLQAFNELASKRTTSLGYGIALPQPIPQTEITSWCDLMGINGLERENVALAVGVLDADWLEDAYAQIRARQK